MEKVSINKSMHLSEHLASPSEAALSHSSELDGLRLSPHFTLGEVTKSKHNEVYNIPSHVAIENLKRVCVWLEALRYRYNQRYVWGADSPPESGGDGGGLNKRTFIPPLTPPRSALPLCSAKNLGGETEADQTTPGPSYSGGEEVTNEPIIINSGYRSPEVNRKVGGSATSNHLTGCAVDIRVAGIEQALRYAVILMDYADETRQDYDELLIERNRSGHYWVHFAVRPMDNRRKTMFLKE